MQSIVNLQKAVASLMTAKKALIRASAPQVDPVITLASIETLTPDPKNARRRTERSAAMIERSLSEFGAARSIVVDENGVVLAGNGTLEAAAAIGIDRVITVHADGNTLVAVQRSDLTPRQKVELAIADNRGSDTSEFDGATLAQLLEDDPGLDLSPYWSDQEFRGLVAGLDPPAPPEVKGKALEVKLTFPSEGDRSRFLRLLSQLEALLPEHQTQELRIEAALGIAIDRMG